MPRIRTPFDGSTHFRLSSIHAIRQQGADSPTAQVRSFETCGGGRAGERQGSVSQTGSCSIMRFCGRVSRPWARSLRRKGRLFQKIIQTFFHLSMALVDNFVPILRAVLS
jgi:hypothetical protein